MSFQFTDSPSYSPSKQIQDDRLGLRKGFGSGNDRFDYKPDRNPGVGEYEIDRSLIIKTPSRSTKGSYISKCPKMAPIPVSSAPASTHYRVTLYDMNNARSATPFSVAGIDKGKVPWPAPKPIPGPCAYRTKKINDYGHSPFIQTKKSATFSSTTNRDSFFDQHSPAPGVCKYDVIGNTFKGQHDLEWSRSTFTRFQDIDRDNKVPPPTQYFDDKRDLVKQKEKDSLRSVGNFKGKQLGKQNERPHTAIHTFGADKDRFKNSTFGRLDLAAMIPAPGHYDNIFRYSINGGKGRAATADGGSDRKPSSPLKQHRLEPASCLKKRGIAVNLPDSPYLDFNSDYN